MHCTDDRGRRVRLIPQRQLGIMPGMPSPIPYEVRTKLFGKGMEMSFTRRSLVRQGLGLLAIIAWCGVWFVVALFLLPKLPLPPVAAGALLGVGGFLGMPPVMWWIIRSHRQDVARLVASEHYALAATRSARSTPRPMAAPFARNAAARGGCLQPSTSRAAPSPERPEAAPCTDGMIVAERSDSLEGGTAWSAAAASSIPPRTRINIQHAARHGSCIEQGLLAILLLGTMAIGIPGAIAFLPQEHPKGRPGCSA